MTLFTHKPTDPLCLGHKFTIASDADGKKPITSQFPASISGNILNIDNKVPSLTPYEFYVVL